MKKWVRALAGLLVRIAQSLTGRGNGMGPVRRIVAFDVRTRLLHKPSILTIGDHSKIITYPDETNAPMAGYRNPPNPFQMNVWKRHLVPGDLFLDIGANIGIYTIYAADIGASVIACEPDPRNYARLVENVEFNGYEVQALNVAVADRPGTLRLTQGLDSLNHLLLSAADEGIEVEATTLDQILGDRHAAGTKIDVEGAEGLVLTGAAHALAQQQIDMIQFEWAGHQIDRGDDATSAPEVLREAGYSLFRPDIDGNLKLLAGPVTVGNDMTDRDVFALSDTFLHQIGKSR
jgi:FkbM family methyltransferase